MAKNPRPDEENNNVVQQDDAPDLVLNNDCNYELASDSGNNTGVQQGNDIVSYNENDDPEVQRYDQLINALPQTESLEDKEARAKREKRDRLFAAIGDGVSALSNLYFTTKGAPSQGEGVKSMSSAAGEYHNKLSRDAEKRDNSILNKRLNYEKARADRIRIMTDQRMKVEKLQNEVTKLEQQARIAQQQGNVLEAKRLNIEADTRKKDLEAENLRLRNLWYPSVTESQVHKNDRGTVGKNARQTDAKTPLPAGANTGKQPAQPEQKPQPVPQQQKEPQQQSSYGVDYLNSLL